MKKTKIFKSFFIVGLAALSFTACGKKKNKQTTNKATTTSRQTTTKKTEPPVANPNKCYLSNDNTEMIFKKDIENDKLVNLILLEELGRVVDIKPVYESGKIKKVKLTASGESDYINIYDLFEVKDSFKPISAVASHMYFDNKIFNFTYSDVYLKFNDNSISIKYDNNVYTFNTDGTVSNNLDEITSTNKSIKYKGYKANLLFSNDVLSYDFYTNNVGKDKRTITLKKDYIEITSPDYSTSVDKECLEFTNDGKIKKAYKYIDKDGTLKTADEFIVELDENDMPKSATYSDGDDTSYVTISYENNTLTLSSYTDLTDTTTLTGKTIIQYDEYHRIISSDYYNGSDTTPTYLYSYEYNTAGLMSKNSFTNPYGNRAALFEYTDSGLLSKYSEEENGAVKIYFEYEYNTNKNLSKISEYRKKNDNTYYLYEDNTYTYETIDGFDCITVIEVNHNGSIDITDKYVYKVNGNNSIYEEYKSSDLTTVLTRDIITNTGSSLYTLCADYFDTNGIQTSREIYYYDIKDNHRYVFNETSMSRKMTYKSEVYMFDSSQKSHLVSESFISETDYITYNYNYDDGYTNIVKTLIYEYIVNKSSMDLIKYTVETKDTANNYLVKQITEYYAPGEALTGQIKTEGTYNYDLDHPTILLNSSFYRYEPDGTKMHFEITNNNGILIQRDITYYKTDGTTIDFVYREIHNYDENNNEVGYDSYDDYNLDNVFKLSARSVKINNVMASIYRAELDHTTEKRIFDLDVIKEGPLEDSYLVRGYAEDDGDNVVINKVVLYVNDKSLDEYQIYTLKADKYASSNVDYYDLDNYDTDGVVHKGVLPIGGVTLPE